jgi:hypothetical protein
MFETGGEPSKPKRGAYLESLVLSVAAIAFGCVAFADFLNHTIKPNEAMSVAAAKSDAVHGPHGGIDYSATGSIIPLRQAPAVNPCGAK